MRKFTKITGVAAPLDLINIDTDMIISKQFLKTIEKSGLGKHLFSSMRYLEDGNENPDFILNKQDYKNTKILIAGDNFGCGSSREHAAWALEDFGISCIISPSFADIFYSNCFNNSICPIVLKQQECQELSKLASNPDTHNMSIDLAQQQIIAGNKIYKFEFEAGLKKRLLQGLDNIDITMSYSNEINDFITENKRVKPWI